MTRACHGPIRAAIGDAFSDEEIDELVERLRASVERKKRQPDYAAKAREAIIAEASDEITREALMSALVARRAEVAAEVARVARRERIDAMPQGMDEADRLRAYNVGSEKQGAFTSASADAEGRALATSLWGEVELGLKAAGGLIDRLVNFWGFGDKAFERNVAREMHILSGGQGVASTGDADAAKAAKVLHDALERGRSMQNDAGAWIGKLEGYIGRQAHDRLKIAGGFWRELEFLPKTAGDMGAARLAASRKAFRAWRDFIRPKLDPRTFEGLSMAEFTDDLGWIGLDTDEEVSAFVRGNKALKARKSAAQRLAEAGVIDRADDLEEMFLYRVWSDIATGRSEILGGASDVGEFRPPPGKARAVSKSRVLHFLGPDAWMDYHERFGTGSLLGAIMGDLERAGKNTALMRRWGPNPDAAFDNEVARLVEEARARGDAGAIDRLGNPMRRAEFGELTGENNRPASLRFSIIGRAIRLDQTLSKLGGMVLSAIGSDQALAAATMKRAGATWLDGYSGAFGGILRLPGKEARHAADLVDVGARSFASHLTGRFSAGDGLLGWGSWASRLFYKVNGFQFVAEGHRQGVAAMLAAHLGREAASPFTALNAGTRETLERFGIDAGAWDLIRRGATEAPDGRAYLTFENLARIPDEDLLAWAGLDEPSAGAARRVRGELETRLRTMVTNILDDSLTEPRARERVGLTRGSKPGTLLGEAIRTFTQFWSFNQAVIGRHLAPAARGYAGQKPVALLAHLILATTLGGYASIQAKQIAKGREPRSLFKDGELDGEAAGKLWIAALLQGGGLGIYGDFLFGEANRNGLGFSFGSLAGPGVSELEAAAQLVRSAVSGDVADLPADMVRIGVRNAPFANLWYTRLALDYLVLWRLQEAMSPGYLNRYQSRVEDQENTSFLVEPTSALN